MRRAARPHLRQNGAQTGNVCEWTGLTPAHICTGSTFAPGLALARLGAGRTPPRSARSWAWAGRCRVVAEVMGSLLKDAPAVPQSERPSTVLQPSPYMYLSIYEVVSIYLHVYTDR